MSFDASQFPKVLTLYLALSQYPILAPQIRERMRHELFQRGVIKQDQFEAEVREKAIQSQQREGFVEEFNHEPPDLWHQRTAIVRDNLTDFYFAYNLPFDRFEELVKETLTGSSQADDVLVTIHPELAPWDMLFARGEAYEALPLNERAQVEHHLLEIKVVLIKAMISDHLKYIAIAKDWYDISHLQTIRSRRIGRGKIGGKAAGVMLAEAVLQKAAPKELLERIRIPRSWFLGADVFYQFTQMNGLFHYANQKYKSEEEVRQDFPAIQIDFLRGMMPEDIMQALIEIVAEVGDTPLIVRSSSLLEDSFGTSFAGKYETHFCPNQGSPEENLENLIRAIEKVYASVYNPDVLLYRRRMGLTDYDERMAILIQVVQGRQIGTRFLPDGAGVAFSRNQFRWSPRIDRDAGFLRMVWGLGTRAVEHLGHDFPRLVALSHPDLRPVSTAVEIRHYSQIEVDHIDLESNQFRTIPVSQALLSDTPFLQWIAQLYKVDELQDIVGSPLRKPEGDYIVTFDGLLRRTDFPGMMRTILSTLEGAYATPVDMEFALDLQKESSAAVYPMISILQCRPQSYLMEDEIPLPSDIPEDRVIFSTSTMVPRGHITNIRYIVFVSESSYFDLPEKSKKTEVARLIGRLNQGLADERFILIGPGRWGSNNPELGIPVTYADIYNALALIEMSGGDAPIEPSYGTHFFQDLVEAGIYPLALALSESGTVFRHAFFEEAPDSLETRFPGEAEWSNVVKLIDLAYSDHTSTLELVMDDEESLAVAFLNE